MRLIRKLRNQVRASAAQLLTCQQHLPDSFMHCREMLRIKRSVAASFSQVHYNTTLVEATTTPAAPGRLLLWRDPC